MIDPVKFEKLRELLRQRASMQLGMTASQRLYIAAQYPAQAHAEEIEDCIEEFETLYASLPDLLAAHDRLALMLKRAAAQFQFYAFNHMKKGVSVGNAKYFNTLSKARVNFAMVRACWDALSGNEPDLSKVPDVPRTPSLEEAFAEAPVVSEQEKRESADAVRIILQVDDAHKEAAPIPLTLSCIACGARHVDKGEWATRPHRKHTCQSCGVTWQPALVNTVGVQFLPGTRSE